MKKFAVIVSKLEFATVEVDANSADEAMDKVWHWSNPEFEKLNWEPAEGSHYEVEQADEIYPDLRQRMSLVDKLTAVKNMIAEMEKEMIMQGLLASEPKEE